MRRESLDRFKEDRIITLLIKEKNDNELDWLNRIVSSGLDWQYILDSAKKEGVFSPVYEQLLLLDTQRQTPIPDIHNEFRQTYYLYISQGAYYSHQITEVLDCIGSAKIKTLLFKGPSIDSLIYKDDFFRPRIDLDLIVRKEDLALLEKVLSNIGYFPQAWQRDYPIPESFNSRVFAKDNSTDILLHIHRHIINNLFLMVVDTVNIDMDKIWQETERFKSYNYIFCLGPELQIIYLCEHALKHNFGQLIYLYEIHKLIKYYQDTLDWDKLVLLANEFNLSHIIYYGLYFAAKVLSTGVPKEVLEQCKPAKLTLGERIFINSILNKESTKWLFYTVYLAIQKGFLKKIGFLFRTIFPPRFTFVGYLKRIYRSAVSLSS